MPIKFGSWISKYLNVSHKLVRFINKPKKINMKNYILVTTVEWMLK